MDLDQPLGRDAGALVEAVDILRDEGEEPPFRCSEIRQQGHCPGSDFRKPCEITAVFRKAETAWRAELKSISLAEIVAEVGRKQTPARRAELSEWLQEKLA